MPDFLTSIARRTLGVASVAQPIIAPLFAPKHGLSNSTPALLEAEEMLETPSAQQMAYQSSSGLAPKQVDYDEIAEATQTAHHASSGLANKSQSNREEPIHSQGPEPLPHASRQVAQSKAFGVVPANPPQIDHPAQGEEPPTTGLVGKQAGPTSSREANNPPSLENSAVQLLASGEKNGRNKLPSLPMAMNGVQIPRKKATAAPLEVKAEENPIADASDFTSRPQGARMETGLSLETREYSLLVPTGVQDRVLPAQPDASLLREIGDERSLSGSDHPSAQLNICEIVKSEAVQASAQPLQTISLPNLVSEVSPFPKREATSSGEHDLLVPNVTMRPDRRVEQGVTHMPTNGLMPAHEQNTSLIERQTRAGTFPELQDARAAEPRQTRSAEVPPVVPTVHVTIGRIDVRAVTPPAPTTRSKPTRSGPTLSLEDYARQQRGGR